MGLPIDIHLCIMDKRLPSSLYNQKRSVENENEKGKRMEKEKRKNDEKRIKSPKELEHPKPFRGSLKPLDEGCPLDETTRSNAESYEHWQPLDEGKPLSRNAPLGS
ncbi:hypothetical protein CR513_04862, partial [Mucuna pruriens]